MVNGEILMMMYFQFTNTKLFQVIQPKFFCPRHMIMMMLLPLYCAFVFSIRYCATGKLSRDAAQKIVDQQLLPKQEYGKRIEYGRDAQGLHEDDDILIKGDDPVLSFTYGEFPLHSTDLLLDAALEYLPSSLPSSTTTTTESDDDDNNNNGALQFLDLGSGCGRLCLYFAMTRPFRSVHGIEIANVLHREALRARDAALRGGWLKKITTTTTTAEDNNGPESSQQQQQQQQDNNICHLSLHQGPASDFTNVLERADLIFCYCTTWETSEFSTDVGALVLSNEWNELFTNNCKPGCIVVTTDRALDPKCGWKILNRMDVSNPEVMESTGFIQQLVSR